MVTPSAADSWEPAAYILRGQYCPRARIRKTLAGIMTTLRGTRIIHIALDQTTIIGGLCFAEGYPAELGTELEQLASRADYYNTSPSFIELCKQTVNKTQPDPQMMPDSVTSELIRTIVNRRSKGGSLSSSDRSALLDQSYSGMYVNNTGNQGAAEGIDSIILVNAKFHTAMLLLQRSNKLDDLAVQLNSTPESTARNDEAVMRQVAERLHATNSEGETPSFERYASDALDLALDVTRSQGGAVYTISSKRGSSFTLIASRGGLPFPKNLPPGHTGTLGDAISSNKTLQLHRWPLPTIGTAKDRGPDGTILLSPIGGPGGDPVRPAIGALLLFRNDVDNSFNAYDLALARNVTLRMALARTTDVMARIGAVTTTLRTTTDWVKIVDNLPDDGHFESLSVPLPRDVRAAAVRIEPILEDIAQLTGSLAVTLGLALPVATVDESHGLAIVSVASYPPWPSDDDKFPVQTESIGGLNWTTMRTGNPVYAPTVTSRNDYLEARERTVSEFCMPIRQEGLLVGTLNLESELQDAYGPFRPLIASFAGAVGRTLADARASLEKEVIDGAARALNHRHDMEGHLVNLTEAVKLHCKDEDLKAYLRVEIRKMNQELRAMRRAPRIEDERECPLGQIVRRAKKQVGYLGSIPTSKDHPTLSIPIDGHRVKPLQVAMYHILSNMIHSSAASPDNMAVTPLTEITVSQTELQGRKQAVLTFQNRADSYLDPVRMADLYRCPVPDSGGRLRVGAFLAGLNARQSLARLHCGVLPDERTLRTTLIIPLESLSLCHLYLCRLYLSTRTASSSLTMSRKCAR